MNVLDYAKNRILYFDGGMGTLLQREGMKGGDLAEHFNIERPDVITRIQADYFRAGTDIITANTFGVNGVKYKAHKYPMEELIKAAYDCADAARSAVKSESPEREMFIAFDMSQTGKLLEPLGELSFDAAVEGYKPVVEAAKKCGYDLILVETMSDLYEMKAAVVAAKMYSDLPIFTTVAFEKNGHLLTGSSVTEVVTVLEGLGVDAIGMNCSMGPVQMEPIINEIISVATVPVIINPNAGLPKTLDDGSVTYDITPDEFAAFQKKFAEHGAAFLGGCCGTTPEYIKKTADLVGADTKCKAAKKTEETERICSLTCTVNLEEATLAQFDAAGDDALDIAEEASDAFDDADDANVIELDFAQDLDSELAGEVIKELQSILSAPIIIKTSDKAALTKALKMVTGRAGVLIKENARGSEELEEIADLYGAAVIWEQ